MIRCISLVARSAGTLLAASVMVTLPMLYLRPWMVLAVLLLELGLVGWLASRVGALREGLDVSSLRSALPSTAVVALCVIPLAPNLARLNRWIFPSGVDEPDPFATLAEHPLGHAAVLLLSVILSPLIEELVIRGWLQRELSVRIGLLGSLTLSSAVFAAMHLTAWRVPYFFVLGLFFGGVFALTRSIWASFLVHATYNGVILAMPAVFPTMESFAEFTTQPPTSWLNAVLVAGSLVLSAIAARKLRLLTGRATLPSAAGLAKA